MSLPKNSAAPPSESVAQDQIRAFVDRILRLKGEAKDINRDIREVYAEAKGNGFDKTVLGKLVSYVEKRANGANDLQEAEALFDLYLSAYDGASHRHAREEASEADIEEMRAWARRSQAETIREDYAAIEPEAAMLPQTVPLDGPVNVSAGQASVESPATSSLRVSADMPGNDACPSSSAGTGGEADRQPITDLTQPNPICRDPGDCGVYASWHHPCLACKRAANVRAAA